VKSTVGNGISPDINDSDREETSSEMRGATMFVYRCPLVAVTCN